MRKHPLGASTVSAAVPTSMTEASSPPSQGLTVLRTLGADDRSDSVLAQVPPHPTPLALRILKPGLGGAEFVTRSRALAGVAHASLVQVMGAGTLADGRVYVAHEHLEAPSLAVQALPIDQLVTVGLQLAQALEVVHDSGFALGGVTPAQVWLSTPPRLDATLAGLGAFDPRDDVRALVKLLVDAGAAGFATANVADPPAAPSGAPDEQRSPNKPALETSARLALETVTTAAALVAALQTIQRQWRARTHLSGEHQQPSLDQEEPNLTGQQLGQYALERILGEGAMGRVYLGRHLRIGRRAAVKVLKWEHARNADLVNRFIQEAQAVNAIKNEHIVEVYDFGEAQAAGQNRVYCVMELLEGRSLTVAAEGEALSITRIARIGQQMARALHAAHQVGVVHRDVKPDNIHLSHKGDDPDYVKVLDFGVAKLLKPLGDLPLTGTQAGLVVGTPEYMAPEQALGMPTDKRTDIYAVGLVMYELLSGVLPFQGDTFGKLVVEITSKPTPALPTRARSGEVIPLGLGSVVFKALAKDFVNRYESGEALADALEPFANPGAAAAQLQQATDAAALEALDADAVRSSPWPKVVGGLAVAGALAAAVVVAMSSSTSSAPAPPLAPPVAQLAATPPPPAPPEPPKAAAAPSTVWLEVSSTPAGAKVVRLDTKAALGVTPLKLELSPLQTLGLELTKDGHAAVRRDVALTSNVSLVVELPAKEPARPAAAKKKKGPVSRDAVLDPFSQ